MRSSSRRQTAEPLSCKRYAIARVSNSVDPGRRFGIVQIAPVGFQVPNVEARESRDFGGDPIGRTRSESKRNW